MNRRRLPEERKAIAHSFSVDKQKCYIIVGLYEDGTPGELFIRISKKGSTLAGAMNSFAVMVSLALQYGIPLVDLVGKFKETAFDPAGPTSNQDIPFAKSLIDYIFKWLEREFLKQVV